MFDYRCRSKWIESIGAVTLTNNHLMASLDQAPKYLFTSILRTQSFANHRFYNDLSYHRQEYTALLARRSDLTDAAAIHIALHQMIQDLRQCHPIARKLENWTTENSRARRFAATTLKQLRYTFDIYRLGFITLYKQLSGS